MLLLARVRLDSDLQDDKPEKAAHIASAVNYAPVRSRIDIKQFWEAKYLDKAEAPLFPNLILFAKQSGLASSKLVRV